MKVVCVSKAFLRGAVRTWHCQEEAVYVGRGIYVLCRRHCPPWPLPLVFCSLHMAFLLKFLLNFLSKLPCKLRGSIPRCLNFKSWALLLAFLGRRFGIWRPKNDEKGTFLKAEQAEHLLPGTGTGTGTGPGAPAGVRVDVRRDAIACSGVPASARHPSRDPTTAARSSAATHPGPANLTAEPQHDHPQVYPLSVFDSGIYSSRSCPSLSIHSRASDRLSIIQSRSYESLPKANPKAAHRQFGCGPSTDRLEVSSHRSSRKSISLTGVHRHRWAESSTSVVVAIQNPSTDSLPRSQLVDSPTPPEEPYSIGSPTVHSSPASKSLILPEETPSPSPTTSSTFNLGLPESRVLQMIISEQVPRYTKSVPVQVIIIITPLKLLRLGRSRERRNYDIKPLTTTFSQYVCYLNSHQYLMEPSTPQHP